MNHLLQPSEETSAVQQRVPPATDNAVVAFKVWLVVGTMRLAANEDVGILQPKTVRL